MAGYLTVHGLDKEDVAETYAAFRYDNRNISGCHPVSCIPHPTCVSSPMGVNDENDDPVPDRTFPV